MNLTNYPTKCWACLVVLLFAASKALFAQAPRPFPADLPACLQNDFRQLETLYDNTQGDDWLHHEQWFTGNLALWHGITLTADGCDVQEIRLGANGLIGILPNLALPKLTCMMLNDNQLRGAIPNFNFPMINTLYLNNNLFNGEIPNFNLPQLAQLGLYNNQLTGLIPSFNLPQLTLLDLGRNRLCGKIPHFNLPQLRSFNVAYNQLSGRVPTFSAQMSQLMLSNNQFNFGNLENSTWLNATLNYLQYTPQAKIPIQTQGAFYTVSVGGTVCEETFNWYLNGVLQISLQGDSLFKPSKKGFYKAEILHNGLPDLVLYSETQFLNCYTMPTVQYRTIRQGQNVVVNDHIYSQTGIYFDTIVRSLSCDSLVTTHLTVLVDTENPVVTNPINVFPNPTTGLLMVEHPSCFNPKILIFNTIGNLLEQVDGLDGKTSLDMSAYQNGIYLVRVHDKMFKILKQ